MSRAFRSLLDEMHTPALAAGLRRLGHDAVAAADRSDLRGRSDAELLACAADEGRCLVTENARDYRRIVQLAMDAGRERPPILYTSSKSSPRSREDPGPLARALDAWLRTTTDPPPEDWLRRCE